MRIKDIIFEARKSRARELRRKRLARNILGVSTGLSVGVLAGILLAPQSGEKTRKQIKEKAKETTEQVKEIAIDKKEVASKKAKNLYKDFINKQNEIKEEIKDHYNNLSEKDVTEIEIPEVNQEETECKAGIDSDVVVENENKDIK